MEIKPTVVTINGVLTPASAGAFIQNTEDVSDYVDINENRALVIDSIDVTMPGLDDVPGSTNTHSSTVCVTHTSQTALINYDDEDLIQRFLDHIVGMGTAATVLNRPSTQGQPKIFYSLDHEKPVIYRKNLYISQQNTDSAVKAAYYLIKCRKAKLTEKEAKGLLANISEDL